MEWEKIEFKKINKEELQLIRCNDTLTIKEVIGTLKKGLEDWKWSFNTEYIPSSYNIQKIQIILNQITKINNKTFKTIFHSNKDMIMKKSKNFSNHYDIFEERFFFKKDLIKIGTIYYSCNEWLYSPDLAIKNEYNSPSLTKLLNMLKKRTKDKRYKKVN